MNRIIIVGATSIRKKNYKRQKKYWQVEKPNKRVASLSQNCSVSSNILLFFVILDWALGQIRKTFVFIKIMLEQKVKVLKVRVWN